MTLDRNSVPPLILWLIGLGGAIVSVPLWVSSPPRFSMLHLDDILWIPFWGATFAVLASSAVIAAFGKRRMSVRLAISAGVWLIVFVSSVGARVAMGWMDWTGPHFLQPRDFDHVLQELKFFIAGYWGALIPLGSIRAALNWRIAKPNEVHGQTQWTVAQILIATAGIAVSLGLILWIIRRPGGLGFVTEYMIDDRRWEVFIGFVSVCGLSMLPLPLLTAVLMRPGSWWRYSMMSGGWLFMVCIVTCVVIIMTSPGDPTASTAAMGFVLLIVTFTTVMGGMLLPMRFRGDRLLWGWKQARSD